MDAILEVHLGGFDRLIVSAIRDRYLERLLEGLLAHDMVELLPAGRVLTKSA